MPTRRVFGASARVAELDMADAIRVPGFVFCGALCPGARRRKRTPVAFAPACVGLTRAVGFGVGRGALWGGLGALGMGAISFLSYS